MHIRCRIYSSKSTRKRLALTAKGGGVKGGEGKGRKREGRGREGEGRGREGPPHILL